MNSQELGQQVKKKRQELGMSQDSLATQADISRNYLSIIERGEAKNVSMGVLTQLAAALGVTPGELIGEAADTLISPALREFALKDGLSFAVIDRLSRIPRRGQEPRTAAEWRKLYGSIQQYLKEED